MKNIQTSVYKHLATRYAHVFLSTEPSVGSYNGIVLLLSQEIIFHNAYDS